MQPTPYQIGYDIAMQTIPGDSCLARAYGIITNFLMQFPEMQATKKKSEISSGFLKKHVRGFAAGRQSKGPVMPKTVPDEIVKDVLEMAYSVPPDMLEEAIIYHREAMGAENFIGWILESYIASEAEPLGWVWCSGSMIKAVDFIYPINRENWKLLQVKNRSNSENSSSSQVREGTSIEKWFRVHARTGKTNWSTFPDQELRTKLSEEKFRDYLFNWGQRNFLQRS